MAKQQPEAKLTNQIKKAILAEHPGSFVVKVHGGMYQQAGLPDLLAIVEGRVFGLEVKVPGREDTLTPRQAATLAAMRKAGAKATMVSSVDRALAVIEEGLR